MQDLQLQHVGSSFPDKGLNPGPLHWECRVLATEPPGKSLGGFLLTFPPIFMLCPTLMVEKSVGTNLKSMFYENTTK